MGKLSPKFIETAPPGRHSDGRNLYLLVKKSGSKSWVLRYQYNGVRRDIGLGSAIVPEVDHFENVNAPLFHKNILTLSEARKKSIQLLALARAGKNPIKERDHRKPLHPRERDKWTQSGEEEDDDYFVMSERERRATPSVWIHDHSRHVKLLPGQKQRFEDRLHQLWQLQHGSKRPAPTFDDQQFQLEILRAELDHATEAGSFAVEITSLIQEWQSSKHPSYVDYALLICRRKGIFPPPTLVSISLLAAERRLTTDLPGMTPQKISRRSGLKFALIIMTNLILSGATQEQAASKTAQYFVNGSFPNRWKASTLDKRYSEHMHSEKDTVVRQIHREWNYLVPHVMEQWRQFGDALPEATTSIKGERR
jgi:hypothetical protein